MFIVVPCRLSWEGFDVIDSGEFKHIHEHFDAEDAADFAAFEWNGESEDARNDGVMDMTYHELELSPFFEGDDFDDDF